MSNQIKKVRQFNRFYIRFLGFMNNRLLDTPLSLTEARVTMEIGANPGCTAAQLARFLRLDRGYVSRILRRLERDGYLEKQRSRADGRSMSLKLTKEGQALVADLDQRANEDINGFLNQLTPGDRTKLINSMETITSLLSVLDRP